MRPVLSFLVLILLCGNADAQSCRTRSYSYSTPTYSSGYSYSYSAPSYSYSYPVKKVTEYKVEDYKPEATFVRLTAFFPTFDVPTYGASPYVGYPYYGSVYQPPFNPLQQPQQGQQGGSLQSKVPDPLLQQILQEIQAVKADVNNLKADVADLKRGGRFAAPPPGKGKDPEPIQPPPNLDKGQAKFTAFTVNKNTCAICHERGNEQHGGDFVMSEKDGSFTQWTEKQISNIEKMLLNDKMPKVNKRGQEHGILGPLNQAAKEALLGERDQQVARIARSENVARKEKQ